MTLLATALARGVGTLRDAGVPDAPRDARVLLAHAAGIAPDRLTLHLPDAAEPSVLAAYDALLARRAARVPVSHLVGGRLFWGRWFRVTPAVLDPRPETETLLAEALRAPFSRVLDLGTGSGAIVLSLLADRGDATGVGVDLSPEALTIAASNARDLGVDTRVHLLAGSWFGPVAGQFDLIVSNPPYIAEAEMASLSPEVLHEPRLALTPGGDGLEAYRAIAAGVLAHLRPGGRLVLEIGPTQGAAVVALLQSAGLTGTAVLADLDGRDRVVTALAP